MPSRALWSTCNVGASRPEDYGLYFAWGETKGYATGESKTFSWSNYKWCNKSSTTITKYCTSRSYGTVDNLIYLEPEDDAATVNMGGNWRMPYIEEFQELKDNCNFTWTTKEGISGALFTSKINPEKELFIPASGYRSSSTGNVGTYGYLLTKDLGSRSDYTKHPYVKSGTFNTDYEHDRYIGLSIRGVIPCIGNITFTIGNTTYKTETITYGGPDGKSYTGQQEAAITKITRSNDDTPITKFKIGSNYDYYLGGHRTSSMTYTTATILPGQTYEFKGYSKHFYITINETQTAVIGQGYYDVSTEYITISQAVNHQVYLNGVIKYH